MRQHPLPISLCMIVRDAAADLGECLGCVADWFAETVVLDTGSGDETVAVARHAGAIVHAFEWCDDYAAARNAAIAHATQPWILMLDADERLSPDASDGVAWCIEQTADAFVVAYRNYTQRRGGGFVPNDGSWPPGREWAGWVPGRVVRLFRNGRALRFYGRVHETLDASLRAAGAVVLEAPFVIHHLHERHGWDYIAAKQRRYGRILERAAAQGEADAVALTNLAIIKREFENDAGAASDILRRAIRQDAECRQAWHELVATLVRVGRIAQGRAVAGDLIRRWPDDADGWHALGLCEQHLGNLSEAEEAYRAAVQRAHHLRAGLALAELWLRVGRVGEARSLLEGFLDWHSTEPRIARLLSAAYATLGCPAEARRLLDRLVANVPNDPVLWNNLGVLRAQAGDRRGAAEAFRRVLHLEPEHPEAHRNLAALEQTP